MGKSVLTLFCLNLAFVLFPVLSPEFDPTGTNALFFEPVALYGRALSSVVTPLLVAATLAFTLPDIRKRPLSPGLLLPPLLVCVFMCISAMCADTVRFETLLMGVFFLLFSIYLAFTKAEPEGAETIVALFKACFIVWLLAPLVAMLIDPSLTPMFVVVSLVDISYHGLSDSRVGFGLWVSVFILLIGKPRSRFEWFLMLVSAVTLMLSQSRAAVLGLLLSGSYALLRRHKGGAAVVVRVLALLTLCLLPLLLWSAFGREDALTVSEDRGLIWSRFLEYVQSHWLLGDGGMYVIELPEFDKVDVPAHNLLLQTVANYGVFTLVALLVFLAFVFHLLRSTRARMLLIFFVVYSMYQPVQGTGNFFNPLSLLFFLLTFAVDNSERRGPAPGLRAPARLDKAKQPWRALSHAASS